MCVAATGAERDTARPKPPWERPSRRGRGDACPAAGVSVDFEHTREAYKSKDSLELLRSLVVFKLCSYDILVDKNKEIMDLGKKVMGRRAFERLMKMTFYGQFVAGEDHRAIRPLLQKNRAFGVGSVLDYSVEEDLRPGEDQEDGLRPYVSTEVKTNTGAEHRQGKHGMNTQCGERHGGSSEAGTCFYADEAKCDRNVETFLECIRASGGGALEGFSAIKMTALARPQFLLRLSEVLVKWRRFFSFLAAQQGYGNRQALEQKLALKLLQEFLSRSGAEGDVRGWFTDTMQSSSGTIDMLDWDLLIDSRADTSHLLVLPDVGKGELVPLLDRFTAEEERQMKRILQRMDVLAKHAEENGVRLMVDAEQTYLQPAISYLTLAMQRVYNGQKPLILNTYQCYLKEAFTSLSVDLERSRRQGGLVPGGQGGAGGLHAPGERAGRAAGLPGPHPPRLPGNQSDVPQEISLSRKANVMVASHNEDTVRHTLRRMNELGLAPAEGKVSFGQLLGMCDQISFPLGRAGFPVHKELKRRLGSGEIFHRPVF
ncbi:unnamed protein product [Arctogadus glacialis]